MQTLGKNIALSYWLKDDDPLKYSDATPMKIYDSICRTIKSGSPSEERIVEDVYRIKEETLRCITEAKGTYIEDSSNKKSRNGVRLAAAREEQKTKKNAIKTDPAVEKKFAELFRDLQKGAAPMPCKFEDGGTRGTIRDEDHSGGEFLTMPLVEEALARRRMNGTRMMNPSAEEKDDTRRRQINFNLNYMYVYKFYFKYKYF